MYKVVAQLIHKITIHETRIKEIHYITLHYGTLDGITDA